METPPVTEEWLEDELNWLYSRVAFLEAEVDDLKGHETCHLSGDCLCYQDGVLDAGVFGEDYL